MATSRRSTSSVASDAMDHFGLTATRRRAILPSAVSAVCGLAPLPDSAGSEDPRSVGLSLSTPPQSTAPWTATPPRAASVDLVWGDPTETRAPPPTVAKRTAPRPSSPSRVRRRLSLREGRAASLEPATASRGAIPARDGRAWPSPRTPLWADLDAAEDTPSRTSSAQDGARAEAWAVRTRRFFEEIDKRSLLVRTAEEGNTDTHGKGGERERDAMEESVGGSAE